MNIYTRVSLNIVAIFLIAMLGTFIPESFPDLFGDWTCQGGHWVELRDTRNWVGCDYWERHFDSEHHWGVRHWLWFCMSVSLFIAQAIRIVVSIVDKSQD